MDGGPVLTEDNLITLFISLNAEAESIAALGGIVEYLEIQPGRSN